MLLPETHLEASLSDSIFESMVSGCEGAIGSRPPSDPERRAGPTMLAKLLQVRT
jgi:hypothetical protein